jgi:signal transduction histidine kinase/ActR/RegA family two-component response regulator
MNLEKQPVSSRKKPASLEDKIFHLVTFWTAIIALLYITLGIFLHYSIMMIIAAIVAFILYSSLYFLARFRELSHYSTLTYTIVTLTIIDFIWLQVGAAYSDVAIILLLAFMISMLMLPKGLRVIGGLIYFFNFLALIIIQYQFPFLIQSEPSVDGLKLAMLISTGIGLLVIWRLIGGAKRQYEVDRQQLKENNRSLKQATEAKSKFLANMSHEIRTPMNGVIGMTELLAQTDLNEEQEEYLKTIQISGQRLLNIINEILDFSKIEAGAMLLENIPFSLKESIEEAVKISSPKIGQKNIALSYQISSDLPSHITGDPGKIRQMLLNLLDNAIKFTDSGQISVKLDLLERDADKLFIQVSVRDTGRGIAVEKQKLLFQEFSQLDASTTRKFGGTGLGLAIIKKLAEMMGGTVELESEEDKGSTFRFSFWSQAAAPPTNIIEQTTRVQEKKTENPLNILIVEDDKINQKLILRIIDKLGYQAKLATNGLEALQICTEEQFDLIFMDMHMPIMDGIEATTKILEHQSLASKHPSVIIAMTANVLEEDKNRCFEAGMLDYISKPISSDQISTMINRWTQDILDS